MVTTHLADDGTVRQDHYGQGRQPWDDILELGWGPHFAAANVLKHLRRTKDLGHSLQSAQWYWDRLIEMRDSKGFGLRRSLLRMSSARIVRTLILVLTEDELTLLLKVSTG